MPWQKPLTPIGHMETPEQFLKRYFQERTEQAKREIEQRAAYRAKYFTDDCIWDSRRDSINQSESEEITEIATSENAATVMTMTPSVVPYPRLRYHLIRAGDRWLIERVDMRLPTGDEWSNVQEMKDKFNALMRPKMQ
jgi:hypothetical protein